MQNSLMLLPIPMRETPKPITVERIVESHECFIKVEDNEFFCVDMQYHKQGIPGAIGECYVRREVFQKLLDAASKLPNGYKIRIFDAWRPFEVQQYLFEKYKLEYAMQHPYLDESDLMAELINYVSMPIKDKVNYPVHCSGGAVDISIQDARGVLLDMGTMFDSFEKKAETCFFEGSEETTVIQNRRLLYNVMTSVGFANLPSEWWHFDYGTRFWAYYKDDFCRYNGIYTYCELKQNLE